MLSTSFLEFVAKKVRRSAKKAVFANGRQKHCRSNGLLECYPRDEAPERWGIMTMLAGRSIVPSGEG